MRTVMAVLIVAGLGGLYLWQKSGDQTQPPVQKSVVQQHSTPSPVLTTAPRGEASEHNWMKRSLDRARDVTEQARSRTRDSQDP
jgi:hypothetical protein